MPIDMHPEIIGMLYLPNRINTAQVCDATADAMKTCRLSIKILL